jgi:adenine phosphoribosyltransferase
LLADPLRLEYVAESLVKEISLNEVECFAGIESRGFILAMLLSSHFQKGFLPIRKAGKLPPPIVAENYSLEYGNATIEMQPGNKRIVIVDDVLATGGTLQAAINVAQKAGFTIVDVVILINLRALNNMTFNNSPIKHLIEY